MRYLFEVRSSPYSIRPAIVQTAQYIELNPDPQSLPDGQYVHFTFYLLRENYINFYVLASWDHQLDWMMDLMAEPSQGDLWRQTLGETYPTLGMLISNAEQGRLASGVLLGVPDPDDGDVKLCVMTFVGNMSQFAASLINDDASIRELVNDPRILQAVNKVADLSISLGSEIETNEISGRSMARMYGIVGWRALLTGFQFTRKGLEFNKLLEDS
jgi:hypothetical protein